METIDINKVAGLQALDSEGNVLGVVSMEQLTDMVAGKLATELAAQNTAPAMRTMSLQASPAAASVSATGVDKPEQQLLDVSDPKYVRVIGPDGNSGKQGISQFAQVVGGLLGTQKFATSIGALWNFREIPDNDLNNALTTGLYVVQLGLCTNTPTEDACYLEVVSNGTYAIQKLFALNSNSVWFRRILIYLGKYNAWSQIK